MNLMQILYSLPPQVYIRRGELVIQFSNVTDLVARISETAAAMAQLERTAPDSARQDSKPERGRRRLSRTATADTSQTVPPPLSEEAQDNSESSLSPP